jgi:branched-chain amino acid transport system substrate-binding protein
MKMKELAVLAICGLLGAACQPESPSIGSGGDIIIASDLPTSGGEEAQDAVQLQRAIKLAIDQHPSIGRFKLTYRPMDDAVAGVANPQKGVQNVKRMIEDASVLGMIGPYGSQLAFAEIPVTNANDLVMLSPSNTWDCLTRAAPYCDPQPDSLRPTGRNNYFRIAAPDALQGAAMAGFAVRGLGVRRVAAFTEHPGSMGPVIDSFTAILERVGGELVLRQDLQPRTTDFTAFLSAAKARGAEAIYVVGLSAERICVARAMMKGIFPDDPYFLGFDSMADNQCIRDAADNANNRIYATISTFNPTQSREPAVKQVVDAYRKAYPKSADTALYTFAGYDCAMILIDAIKRAIDANSGRIPTRRQVVEAVAHTRQSKGVTGTYSFDTFGDAVPPMMSVYRVDNGRECPPEAPGRHCWVFWQSIDARPG